MRKIIPAFFIACTAHATIDWKHFATCISPDHTSGGTEVYVSTDKILVQVLRIDESVDEYITSQGTPSPLPATVAQFTADLNAGREASVIATKITSTRVEDQISDAALIALKIPAAGTTASAVNASVSRRGKIMPLVCNRAPVTPPAH